ncbi:MAG: hypothetical protein KW793_02005 [Candidatus Doudnabacteria bacterium]|nr:hypothetical protein [Candidatus Doudnabacteria bacterium]
MDNSKKSRKQSIFMKNRYMVILAVVSLLAAVFLVKQIEKYKDNIEVGLNLSDASVTTSLKLTPTSKIVGLNQNFTVDVTLDTGGENIDGLDITFLRFNPSILQVVDSDLVAAGTQIAATSLIPSTLSNSVNNPAGTIQLSQTTTGGSTFNGSGKIATITFKAIAAGTSSVTFDYISGQTTDTNVSALGTDKLSVVQNSSVTVDVNVPTVSITNPIASSTVTGTINISANASDNQGVAGVQFRVDGVNVGSEDTSSPYSVSWNSTSAANGNHVFTAVARDLVDLTATSQAITANVSNALLKSTTITLSFEGRTSKVTTGKLQLLNSSKTLIIEQSFTTNASGQATVSYTIPDQSTYLKVIVTGYLTRVQGPFVFSALPVAITFPILLGGELTGDNIVNSLDFSYMNSKWFSADVIADINQDGLVNTIDYSVLNNNWFVSGEI